MAGPTRCARLRALGRARVPGRHERRGDPACRRGSCTWRATSPCSSPPRPEEARAVIERRAGTAYDPRLTDLALHHFDELLDALDETRIWEQALELEPFPKIWIAGERVDVAFTAVAAFTDLKSPWLREHCTGVAELAEAPPGAWASPPESVTLLRRAALAHDLGRVGVSNAIWEKPGPLSFGECERVRLHPHFSERAFAQSRALAPIGLLAGAHHERLDGSGYHRGTRGPASTRRRASSRRPTATRRCGGASVPTALDRSRRSRRSSCARRGEGCSTPRPSTPCSRPPGIASRSAHASSRPG